MSGLLGRGIVGVPCRVVVFVMSTELVARRSKMLLMVPSTTRFIFGPDTKPLRRGVDVIVTCICKVDIDIHQVGNTEDLPISVHPTIRAL